MPTLIDLTGRRYGRLLVLKRVENRADRTCWLCKCECGNSTTVTGRLLNTGHTKSCGCYRLELIRLEKGEAAFNSVYRNYADGARRRGLVFCLSKEEFRTITKQNCHYCGAEPGKGSMPPSVRRFGAYTYNGIDRVDNAKGYEMDNIVTCCQVCNFMKHARTQKDFLDHVYKIASFCKEWAI